jgi:hypothetical protein
MKRKTCCPPTDGASLGKIDEIPSSGYLIVFERISRLVDPEIRNSPAGCQRYNGAEEGRGSSGQLHEAELEKP